MKILVRGPNWIGDAVMAVPALRSLALSFPEAHLTLVASPLVVDLYRGTIGVNDLRVAPPAGLQGRLVTMPRLARELRHERYDLGIAFTGSFSSALLLWMAGARERVGYATEGRKRLLTRSVSPEATAGQSLAEQYMRLVQEAGGRERRVRKLFSVPAADVRLADGLLREAGLHPRDSYLAIAPGASYGPAKRWPAERFGELAREIGERYDWPVVVVGSPAEKAQGGIVARLGGDGVVDLTGRTPVRALSAILQKARLLVSNDSGAMHLAAAMGTKVVALFGSTDPEWTTPLGEGHRIIYHDVSCSPCMQRTCSIGTVCLTSITVKEVLSQVQQALFVLYQKTPREPVIVPRPVFRPRVREEGRREGPPFGVLRG